MTANAAERPALDPQRATLEHFSSADAAMRRCLEVARVAAGTDIPILILGESGTGKSLLARAIHNSSRRAAAPFVPFNAAALSETLLDSQLFGHEKGAFTGADRRVKGKFEQADGGTLFIDEIGDMTPAAQAKILRAVEHGEFERLGSEKLQQADVRLVSATHWPLRRFLDSDRFRRDLFYRIGGLTITIPPLRERPNDLRALVAAEIQAASRQLGRPVTGLDKRAAELLLAYDWPGNLRELNRVLQSAVALTPGDVVPADAIGLLLEAAPGAGPSVNGEAPAAPAAPEELSLRAAERRHIREVLARAGGNKRKAARLLGVSRSTLDRKLTP